MAKVPSINDLLLRLPPETLDKVCSEEHLLKLTEHFSAEWINIATYLRLTGVEQKVIEINWPRNLKRQRREMFGKWRKREKDKATYRSLVQSLYDAGRVDLINELCEIVERDKQEMKDGHTHKDHSLATPTGESSDDSDTENEKLNETESSQTQPLTTKQTPSLSSLDPMEHSSQISSQPSKPGSQSSVASLGSALTNPLSQSDPPPLPPASVQSDDLCEIVDRDKQEMKGQNSDSKTENECEFSRIPDDSESPLYTDDYKEKIIQNHKPKVSSDPNLNFQKLKERVKLILLTCNENEKWVVCEKLEPPSIEGSSMELERALYIPQNDIVIGVFAGYTVGVLMTEQGNKSSIPLKKALDMFPYAQAIIAVGVGYGKSRESIKFADVMVSDHIENASQVAMVEVNDTVTVEQHGARPSIKNNLLRYFKSTDEWYYGKGFQVTKEGRKSKAVVGTVVSCQTLMGATSLRDKYMDLMARTVGGEMEGSLLLSMIDWMEQKGRQLGVIVIKGVADYGDNQENEKWQLTAAKAAVDFVHYCLKQTAGQGHFLPVGINACIVKYANYLKQKYKGMSALPNPNWPPSVKEPVKLALVERKKDQSFTGEEEESIKRDYAHGKIDNIVAKKKEIEFIDIFKPETSGNGIPLKILMDGAPGVGKTTRTRKACVDWANGEILQEYDLVVLAPLREAKSRRANDIMDLLPCDDLELKKEVTKQIRKTSGKNILLIFDGFDELSAEQRMQDSLFLNVIKGDSLLECTVLVTSRPYASDCIQCLESVNRHVEILGFAEKQIEACIMNNIPDKLQAKKLLTKLQERLDIVSLCYIPLNCAIVMYVYQKHNYTLPSTLTSLYSDFVLDTLKRNAKIVKKDNRMEKMLASLTKLHMPDVPEEVKNNLFGLCELAYKGMMEDRFVFKYQDLCKALPNPDTDKDIESYCLGVLTCVKSFTSSQEEQHYQFLHLSIQEFLAAKYVADTLTGDKQLAFFIKHLKNARFQLMLLFLAGLTNLNISSPEKLFCKEKLKPSSLWLSKDKKKLFLFLGHLIFESNEPRLYSVLLQNFADKQSSLNLKNSNLNDPGLITNIVSMPWLSQTIDLKLKHKFIGSLVKDSAIDLSCLAHIKSLDVSVRVGQHMCECRLTDSCLYVNSHVTLFRPDFIARMLQVNTSLEVLDLHGGSINADTIAKGIAVVLTKNSSLREVNLSENEQLAEGDSEAVGRAIERMLQVTTTLKVLDLHGGSISDTIAKGIAAGLMTKKSSLEKLNIDSNKLSDNVIAMILSSANSSNTLCHLQLCGVQLSRTQNTWKSKLDKIINMDELRQFIYALNQSSMSIQLFQLRHIFITSSQAVILFQSLDIEHNASLQLKELDLSKNEQLAKGNSEAVGHAIERMLRSNSTPKTLDLSDCSLPSTVLVHLFKGLRHNKSLKELKIVDNKLEENDSVAMAEMLSHNEYLTELNVRWCWSNWFSLDVRDVRDHIKRIAGPLLRNTSLETVKVGGSEKRVLLEEIERVKREKNIDTSNWKIQIIGFEIRFIK